MKETLSVPEMMIGQRAKKGLQSWQKRSSYLRSLTLPTS